MNRLLQGFSLALLVLLALCELYSAAAVMSDYPKAPSWEHILSGPLFALPCVLVLGIVFLIWTSRKKTGFVGAASSLILYVSFLFGDTYPIKRRDWIVMAVWIVFCAMGIVAARFLLNRTKPSLARPEEGR
jgi:hypothetical protein